MKCSIQILNRADGFLAFDTNNLAFWEVYADEIVLGFTGASEPMSLFRNDVSPQDFDILVDLLRKEFPEITRGRVLEQP
jgi:hypothetical protein